MAKNSAFVNHGNLGMALFYVRCRVSVWYHNMWEFELQLGHSSVSLQYNINWYPEWTEYRTIKIQPFIVASKTFG